MPFVDTSSLAVIERLPGWYGRYFHSASMTFAHYDFKRGSSVHEHSHPQEEVYEVIEGELEDRRRKYRSCSANVAPRPYSLLVNSERGCTLSSPRPDTL
jgi:hypothetical protein